MNKLLSEKAKKETGLATTQSQAMTIAGVADAERAKAEIQAAFIMAKQFPRDESIAGARLQKACERSTFAAIAYYSFPRGGTNISGASINLAKEFGRIWGNIRFGTRIVSDDDEKITIEGYAWDIETNAFTTQQITFKKLIYRKAGGWIVPDERDLRELCNKHGSIVERNCILKLAPKDIIDEAFAQAKKTVAEGIGKDKITLEQRRRAMIRAFMDFGVSPDMICNYLEHGIDEATPDELAELAGIYNSIRDANSTIPEHFTATQKQQTETSKVMGDLTKPQEAKTAIKIEVPAPRPTNNEDREPLADSDTGIISQIFDIHFGKIITTEEAEEYLALYKDEYFERRNWSRASSKRDDEFTIHLSEIFNANTGDVILEAFKKILKIKPEGE